MERRAGSLGLILLSVESTGNLQAPVLINYKNMVGRQIILTETPLSSRHPLA